MRTETINYNVYKYNELGENAKEKVKQWYLDGQEAYIFTEDCEQNLYNLFGKIDLKVQYSLSYCQGDGFNIYGKINAKNIFDCLEKHNSGEQFKKYENMLTEKEKKTILHYQDECDNIELPANNHYCYCLADYIDIANNWEFDLKNYAGFKNINIEVLKKFEKMVREIFKELCKIYEKWGYEYFYEISEEDLEEMCECNDYEFLADGTLFI